MKRISLAALVSIALAGFASGAILDWGSTTAWSDGVNSGSFNPLSNNGSATSIITPLTFDFGGGLTALVTASLSGTGANWQDGSSYYAGFAPYSYQVGNVLALGVSGGPAASGSIHIQFSSAVTLDSLTIGDVDSRPDRNDVVQVTSSNGSPSGLQLINAPANPAVFSSVVPGTATLAAASGDEGTFGVTASSAWATIGSGTNTVTDLTFALGQTGTGTGGHGVWLSNLTVTAIPEPSTYAMILGCGTFALVAARRRFGRRS
jgi:hypothetical protein